MNLETVFVFSAMITEKEFYQPRKGAEATKLSSLILRPLRLFAAILSLFIFIFSLRPLELSNLG